MPELPDVEYFTSYFKRTSLHKKIVDVKCRDASLVRKVSCRDFIKKLKGQTFQNALRRGKFMICTLKGNSYKLVLHFGMTGNLQYRKIKNDNPDYDDMYAKIVFQFINGYEFLWINKRKLGKAFLIEDLEKIDLLRDMGPEPLKISMKEFIELMQEKEKKNVKSFMMDQSTIAGIGNEYSNEILFRCGVSPARSVESLKAKDRKKLYKTMKSTLKKAIKVGPPKVKFNSSWLLAHLDDMTCPKNKNHKLKKKRVAGRSAVYCPQHQK